ncbi:VIR protein [Plasmodium vivax]|uniref:VIR protein n=1 Tax=Plasmodium vivax TaxID=5855 RepID=A0A1G4E5L0_PLAVI|nr:VIR protein [Plasmodium vivax]
MIEFYRRIYSNYFRSQKGSCLNKYHTVKKNIEKQINDFYKISGRNVYKEWDQLYKYIIDTDKDLKVCYDNKYVNVKLIEDDTIKKFTEKCKRNRTCYNVAPPAKKSPIIKPTTQGTCNNGKECKNETSVTGGVKSQSELSSGAANTQSSERNVSQEQGQKQADVQKSRQEIVVPQPQTITMHSGSSNGTHDKASQKIVIHHSTTPGMVETQEQQLKDSSPSGIRELESYAGNPSSECVPGKESDLTCISTGEFLDTKGIQTNQRSDNPLDTKHSGSQDSVGKNVAGQTGVDKDIIRETPLNLSPTESTSDSVQRAGEDPLLTATDSGSIGSLASDPKNTRSAALAGAPSSDADTNGITDVDISTNYRAPGGEINSVKVFHNNPLGNERSCIEQHCSTEKGNELTDNQSGFFGKIFEVIPNKEHVIKASAPMGIVLLLGLLFKFTPLWRVLNKKNRKKGAGIIEELNSVVQEPSIMDDERSIPFSYGAFEYSS